MANQNLGKPDALKGDGRKPTKDKDKDSASEPANKAPPSETEDFTDPSTSGGATAEDQDSASGQYTT